MKPFPVDLLTTMARAARWLAVLYGLVGIIAIADLWASRTFQLTIYPVDYITLWLLQLVVLWLFSLLQLITQLRLATWTSQFAPALGQKKWQIYLGFYLPVWNLVAPTTFFASLELDRRHLRTSTLALWVAIALFFAVMLPGLHLAATAAVLSVLAAGAFGAYSVSLNRLALSFAEPLAELQSIRRKIVLPRSECELSEVE